MNQVRADSAMPSSARLEKTNWWLTVLNAEDKSRRIRTDKQVEALVAQSNSDTVRRAISVE